MFSNTLFQAVCYGAKECQIITGGTDRKVGYWECCDGKGIRELEGSKSGSINAMDVSPDQNYFVTGGDDKLLKVKLSKMLKNMLRTEVAVNVESTSEKHFKIVK